MVEHEPKPGRSPRKDARTTFEEFTAGASWRELPMKIKLMVLHLWRSERDVAPPSRSDAVRSDRDQTGKD
jgi:hypothetical protein